MYVYVINQNGNPLKSKSKNNNFNGKEGTFLHGASHRGFLCLIFMTNDDD